MINMENIKEEIKEKVQEILDKNYCTFQGGNEADIHSCYDIAELFEAKNKQLLDEIDMLKFKLKAADSVNEQLQFQYNELEKAMYKLTISNDNN